MPVIFLTTTGANNWTVPADFGSFVSIEAIGGGGSGRSGGAAAGGGGGGGGAYSKLTTGFPAATPGGTIPYSVAPAATAGNAASDTWFHATTTLLAKAGSTSVSVTGGPGGVTSTGVGTVKSAGGAGGLGNTQTTHFTGGGGGGAGGPGGVGGTGGAGDATTAGNDGGGGGGAGAGLSTVGGNGSAGTTTAGAGGTNATGGAAGASGGANGAAGASATGQGTLWTQSSDSLQRGPGGGGGGAGNWSGVTVAGGNGGTYGGGGGGGTTGGSGGQGLIVITYSAAFAITISPSAVPIGGGSVSPAKSFPLSITPASMPVAGASLTPVLGAPLITPSDIGAFRESMGVCLSFANGWQPTNEGAGPYVRAALGDLNIQQIRDGWVGGNDGAQNYHASQGTRSLFVVTAGAVNADGGMSGFITKLKTWMAAYPGKLIGIEGPNEVNNNPQTWNGFTDNPGGTPATFAGTQAFMTDLYAAMNADPVTQNVPVLGSVSYPEIATASDKNNIHPYPTSGGYDYDQIVSTKAAQLAADPGKPFWITETGWHTRIATSNLYAEGVSEAVQAKLLLSMYLDAWILGIEKTFQFQLLDTYPAVSVNPGDDENFYGLIRYGTVSGSPTWTRKPGFDALQNFNAIFDAVHPSGTAPGTAYSYSITGMPGTGREKLFQAADGTYLLAVWNEPDIWDQANNVELAYSAVNVTVNLRQECNITVYDPLIGTTAQSTSTGSSVVLSLDDHPLLVKFTPTSGGGGGLNDVILYDVTDAEEDVFLRDPEASSYTPVNYTITIVPATLQVTGGSVSPVKAGALTITPASVPIGGATLNPVRASSVTLTAGAVPVGGSTVNPVDAVSVAISASAVPITGGSVSPAKAQFETISAGSVPVVGSSLNPVRASLDTIAASAVPIDGATITPAFSAGGINYSVTITPAPVPVTGAAVVPLAAFAGSISPSAVPIGGASITPAEVHNYASTITAAAVPIAGSALTPALSGSVNVPVVDDFSTAALYPYFGLTFFNGTGDQLADETQKAQALSISGGKLILSTAALQYPFASLPVGGFQVGQSYTFSIGWTLTNTGYANVTIERVSDGVDIFASGDVAVDGSANHTFTATESSYRVILGNDRSNAQSRQVNYDNLSLALSAAGVNYGTTITPAAMPVNGAAVAQQLTRLYSVAITPAAMPVSGAAVGQQLTRFYSVTVSPSAVPVVGSTVVGRASLGVSIAPANLPIAGANLTIVDTVPDNYSIAIEPSSVPIAGLNILPEHWTAPVAPNFVLLRGGGGAFDRSGGKAVKFDYGRRRRPVYGR